MWLNRCDTPLRLPGMFRPRETSAIDQRRLRVKMRRTLQRRSLLTAPRQVRAGEIPAHGSNLGCMTANRLPVAAIAAASLSTSIPR